MAWAPEVLIVEDEPDMIATYERLLRRHGYRTIAARSRAAGLAAIEVGPPDLLIVDLMLSDGDGLDVVRAARALPRPPPVIVVSGFTSVASRAAATLAGATAVLSKPFSTEAFTKLVRAILEDGRHDARSIQPARESTMRVRELMNRNLVTIAESSSCHEAVKRMHRARVRHLPVLSDDGALVGVVTDRDLRHYLFRPDVCEDIGATSIELLLKAVTVDEIMSAPVVTVDAADDVTDAARIMLEDKIGSLPVTEGGRLVGILTETDVLRELCRADAACSPEVTDIVVSHR